MNRYPSVLVSALLLAVGSALAADWPSWRGVNRDGVTPETGWSHDWPADGPTRIWKAAVGTGFSSVVVADGRLFTMGWADGKDTVHCLDAATGDTRWTRSYPQAIGEMKWGEKGFGQGSVIAAGDRLLVLGEKGELSIVRASPAKFELLARTQAIGGKCWTSPALAAGRLYIRNAKGELVCLDLRPRTKAQS